MAACCRFHQHNHRHPDNSLQQGERISDQRAAIQMAWRRPAPVFSLSRQCPSELRAVSRRPANEVLWFQFRPHVALRPGAVVFRCLRPAWGSRAGMSSRLAYFQNTTSFISNSLAALRDMIRYYRNHPSVVLMRRCTTKAPRPWPTLIRPKRLPTVSVPESRSRRFRDLDRPGEQWRARCVHVIGAGWGAQLHGYKDTWIWRWYLGLRLVGLATSPLPVAGIGYALLRRLRS